MSGLAVTKPWLPLDAATIATIPAQLGVFEIGDDAGQVVSILYAGGRERFGLRSALSRVLNEGLEEATQFRHELTHGYLTRWEELLMVYKAMHGRLPPGNKDHPHPVGRLTVGQSPIPSNLESQP